MNELKLKKAMDTLEFSIQDQEARMQYEARQKYLHDQALLMEAAKNAEKYGFRAGMEKGIEQGIQHAKKQMALRLLRMSKTILLCCCCNRAFGRESHLIMCIA
ncbi:hypothetical protein L2089_15805 [Paenibacillus hunanensis]|uniref:hypothetical protein n=1 Tax=Paenibacillus hunanensis TaxID=539262 RepID=UPI002026F451|nr:hypothetical protein [Paenibacillus hunanensis]MCL9662159.1 hypothetical protein [Paenibacillus hunanensis]